jgi:putative Mn2+ efflux pump MntP
MAILEIIFIAIGLSADAFSVSVGNGISMPRARVRDSMRIAAAFGAFQAIMPLAGYYAGSVFAGYIKAYDHIIALALLGIIGGRMISEGIKSSRGRAEERPARELRFGALLIQAVATSIDALVVGVGFAAVGLEPAGLATAVIFIGVITFALSFAGVHAGKRFGALLGSRAEIAGGAILVAIGLKIFIEHVFF